MSSVEQTSNAFAPSESSSAQQIKTPPPPPQLEVSQAFHHQDSKYKCCGIHAKIGAMIFAISSSITLLYLIYVSIGFINGDEKEWLDWAELIIRILLIPVVICLFVSLYTKNQYLLLPYICHTIIFAILCVIRAIIFTIILIYIFSNEELNEIKEAKKRMGIENFNLSNGWIIAVVVLNIFDFSCTPWIIWVIFLCYQYFHDLKNFRGRTFIGREP